MENLNCQCTKCGTSIKNVIIINGKPYGTECASAILGIKQLPTWFKGGDWDKAKLEQDALDEKNRIAFQEAKIITSKNWNDFIRLSKASVKARNRDNDWEINFINSLSEQAGFYTLTVGGCKFETMEEAEKGWFDGLGSFPYLYSEIKGIDGLSQKQIELLEKIENK